jgi:hypothetical protein
MITKIARSLLLLVAVLAIRLDASDALKASLSDGAFSVAWITDTQYYTEPAGDIGTFLKMTDWVKRYQTERNIRFLVHTGDITNRNTPTQWSRAAECMGVLNGRMPCFLAVGNHDIGPNGKAIERDLTNYNEYFRMADNPLNANAVCAVYEAGHMENVAYFHDFGPWHLLVLSLEFGTRPEVVAWADKIVSTYPDRKVILITHEFIDYDSTNKSKDGMPLRSTDEPVDGHAAEYPLAKKEKIVSAEGIWQQLIDKHDNFIMTLNGHYSSENIGPDGKKIRDSEYASSYRIDKTSCGNFVHQIFFNPQFLKSEPAPGGHGWLRLMEFQPDGETVLIRTFSPYYAMDKDEKSQPVLDEKGEQFSINIKNGTRAELAK